MKRKLKKIVLKYIKKEITEDDRRVSSLMQILDNGHGHKESFLKKVPIDATGEPLPWFTYPSIEYLKQLDISTLSVLEFGLGNSTKFFAKRCKEIFSIEHNKEWFDLIKKNLPGNAHPNLVAESEYAKFPLSNNRKYDIIIVDGINRRECIDTALQIIASDGLIIFDNAERNPEWCEILRSNNFIQIDFHGFGPINNYAWTTSFFFSRTWSLQPITHQPLQPVN